MTTEVWREFISPETIVTLHGEGIRLHGGKQGKPNTDCIDGSIGGAFTASLYSAPNDPPTATEIALQFAGYLLFYLARDSCFVDGNKRVAWTSAMHILGSVGLTLNATEDEAIDLVFDVVEKRVEHGSDVVRWFAKYVDGIELLDTVQ